MSKLITLENISTLSKKIATYITTKITELKTSLEETFLTEKLSAGLQESIAKTITLNFAQSSYDSDTTISSYATLSSNTNSNNNNSIHLGTGGYIQLKNLPENVEKTITINGYSGYFDSVYIDDSSELTTSTDNVITYTTTDTTSKITYGSGQVYITSIVISYTNKEYNLIADSDGVNIASETVTDSTITTLKAGSETTTSDPKTVIYTFGSSYATTSSTSISPSSDETGNNDSITFSEVPNVANTSNIGFKSGAILTIPIRGSATITLGLYYLASGNVNGTSFSITDQSSREEVTVRATSDITITLTGATYFEYINVVYSSSGYNALEVEDDTVKIGSLYMNGNVTNDLIVAGDIYSNTTNKIPKFEKISQTDFDALESKDSDTVYLIYEE